MDLSKETNWTTTLPSNVVATTCGNGKSAVLLVCEHASRHIPDGLGQLGLSDAAAKSHIAWDPGALAVAEQLSSALDATIIAQKISRLVYDCNRPPESKQAIWTQSEVYDIPGNTGLSSAQIKDRIDYIYRPFQRALAQTVQNRPKTVLVTLHSFTPVYNGNKRSVEVGMLHDADSRLADAMLLAAARNPVFKTERNEPYGPQDGVTHTLVEHALPVGHLNVMIEIRNDLVTTKSEIAKVANWLQGILRSALTTLGEEC